MEVSRNLIKFLHSYRSREDDVWTLSSRSVAKPYMVSHPLPAKITELEILISSKANREASADVPTKSRSWFEATIIRGCGAHWYDEAPDWTNETREIPEDFRDDIRARGWDFVPNQDAGQPSAVAFDVMDAHYGNEFSGFRRCVWAQSLDEDNSQGTAAQKFTPLKLIEEGDRFIIWLRATSAGETNSAIHMSLALTVLANNEYPYSCIVWLPVQNKSKREAEAEAFTVSETGGFEVTTFNGSAGYFESVDTPDEIMIEKYGIGWREGKVTGIKVSRDKGWNRSSVYDFSETSLPGNWLDCDHDCLSEDHGHKAGSCILPSLAVDGILRGVPNCSHHESLPPNNASMRHVFIRKGSGADTLQLVLVPAPVTSEMSFVALSYCWGDLSDTMPIDLIHLCRPPGELLGDLSGAQPGVQFHQPFNITASLHHTLWVFRETGQTGPFWIDAICIDQTNMEERAQQVGLMGEIYSCASVVYICPRLNPKIIEPVYLASQTCATKLRDEYGDRVTGFSIDSSHTGFLSDLAYSLIAQSSLLDAVSEFLANPWFSRVWVVQEVWRSAYNAIVIMPGEAKIRLVQFADIIAMMVAFGEVEVGILNPSVRLEKLKNVVAPALWSKLPKHIHAPGQRVRVVVTDGAMGIRLYGGAGAIQKQEFNTLMPILDLFSTALKFQATCPQDKLFALLGMGDETHRMSANSELIQVDYKKSVSQVFRDFSRYCIENRGDLEHLNVVGKTLRCGFAGLGVPIVPQDHLLPPGDHPSWALWHSTKADWTSELQWDSGPPGSIVRGDDEICKVDIDLFASNDNIDELTLRGLSIDVVKIVIPYTLKDGTSDEAFRTDVPDQITVPQATLSTWKELLRQYNEIFWSAVSTNHGPYKHPEELFEAYMSSIIATDEFPKDCSLSVPKSERPRLIDTPGFERLLHHIWAQYWEEELDTLPTSIIQRLKPSKQGTTPENQRKRYFATSLHRTSGRCFSITEKGFVGDCSLGAVSGDTIVALAGSRLPCLLRRKEQSNNLNKWEYVGDCFVRQWMDGSLVEEIQYPLLFDELFNLE